MKSRFLFVCAMVLLVCSTMTAQITSDALGMHNLSPGSGSPIVTAGQLGCVFCHAPHSGVASRVALWNQTLSKAAYTPYFNSTYHQQGNSQPTLGDSTSLCLSCHDGTVAVGQGLVSGKVTETPLNIGTVNGAIDTAPPPPAVSCPDEGTAATSAIAAQVAADALTAYGALVAFPGGLDVSTCPGCGGGGAGELGGRTLAAGAYKSAPGTYGITLGDLTLDAQGNPNAFWVFQMATSLTVGTPSAHQNVILVNGAQAKNVFWQVGSAATINGILEGGTMVGTIISQAGATISTAGVAAVTTINGRVLALSASVTMVNTVINVPAP